MDVLKKLNELKESNNWTDYHIAKESGLAPATVSNIFTRGTVPQISTLEAICKVFGLTLAQFFVEEEKYVFLNESQLKMFERWEMLPAKKKEAFSVLLEILVEDTDN